MNYDDLYQSFVDYQSIFMEDNDFYQDFLKVIQDSQSTFSLVNKRLDKILQSDWINMIEQAIPSIDKCIRNPRKFIDNREEVLPIEISRNITSESIKHLCQHTNLISRVEGDKITPSKILNVFKEESYDTYENKFVYTLLNRLFIFISRRNDALSNISTEENYTMLKMSQEIQVNQQEKLEISLELKSTSESDSNQSNGKMNTLTDIDRVAKLNKVIGEYLSSDFVKQMKAFGYIRPPIMRTNAIMKDVDLRKCLDLWLFIESYESVGYQIDSTDTAQRPTDIYINHLYSISAVQYALFKHYTAAKVENEQILRRVKRKKAIVPKFVKDIYDEFLSEYNIGEQEFKKYMDKQMVKFRKEKVADEARIKRAINDALKVEKALEKNCYQIN